VTGFRFVLFALNYILEPILHPKASSRMICLPASALAVMKSQALSEIRATDPDAFVSEGEIICAWWARLAVLHLKGKKVRTVSLMNAFGLRSIFTSSGPEGTEPLLPKDKTYIANCVQGIWTLLPLSEVLNKPLSYTALAVRKFNLEQGTHVQQEALSYEADRIKEEPLYGSSDCLLITVSNWSKAKFYDIDFSSAVIEGAKGRREERLGRPSYIHASAFVNGYSLRNLGAIFGKDENGRYWKQSTMKDENWKTVEEAFQREWGLKSWEGGG
jgi:hypothetical protein